MNGEAIELRLPADAWRDIAAGIIERTLAESGVADAIRQAALTHLALRGLIEKSDAAKFLGIEIRALENWMKPLTEGGKALPHFKFGRDVRFSIAALEAWAKHYEVHPVTPAMAA